jgi:hypothetical protein
MHEDFAACALVAFQRLEDRGQLSDDLGGGLDPCYGVDGLACVVRHRGDLSPRTGRVGRVEANRGIS